MFSSGDLTADVIEARTAARLRRAELLDDTGKRFTFITASGAIGWRVGSAMVMAHQVEHLIVASRRPNVALGIVAADPAGLRIVHQVPGDELRGPLRCAAPDQ